MRPVCRKAVLVVAIAITSCVSVATPLAYYRRRLGPSRILWRDIAAVDSWQETCGLAFSPDGKELALAFTDGDCNTGIALVSLPEETVRREGCWKGHIPRGVTYGGIEPKPHLVVDESFLQLPPGVSWEEAWKREPPALDVIDGVAACGSAYAVGKGVNVWSGAVFARRGLLATTWSDGKIRAWALRTGELALTLDAPEPSIIAAPDDGDVFVTAGATHVALWSVSRQALVRSIEIPTAARAVAFAPDGREIALAVGDDLEIRSSDDLYLMQKNPSWWRASRSASPSATVTGLAYAPDADLLAAAFTDGHIRLLQAR